MGVCTSVRRLGLMLVTFAFITFGVFMKEFNAKIVRASLGFERGFVTSYLTLEFKGGGQGFGGYVLSNENEFSPHLSIWIEKVLKVVGVDDWSKLTGKVIRVRREEPLGSIVAIGNVIEDHWFCPKEEFAKLKIP